MKNKRQKLEEQCLQLWAKCVKQKAKHICELCGIRGREAMFDAHHIFTKGSCSNLKYNIDNGCCLCKGCHRFRVHIKSEPELIPKLILSRGQEWFNDICRIKHSDTMHRTTSDLEDIKSILSGMIEDYSEQRS